MNRDAGGSEGTWFGLSHSQLLWFVALRVAVAVIAGGAVLVTTRSALWVIVALLASGVVVNAVVPQPRRR